MLVVPLEFILHEAGPRRIMGCSRKGWVRGRVRDGLLRGKGCEGWVTIVRRCDVKDDG